LRRHHGQSVRSLTKAIFTPPLIEKISAAFFDGFMETALQSVGL
jgi:hypothetical protein